LKTTFSLLCTAAFLVADASHAQTIQLDISRSGLQTTGTSTFKVNNLKVEGQTKPFVVEFAWDAASLAFRPITAQFDTSPKWQVTTVRARFAGGTFNQDLSGLCAAQFGFGNVQADWADIKTWINNDATRAQTFINSVGLAKTPGSNVTPYVLVSANQKNSTVNSSVSIPIALTLTDVYPGFETYLGGTIFLVGGPTATDLTVVCNNKAAP
jgi:hypothetical protein